MNVNNNAQQVSNPALYNTNPPKTTRVRDLYANDFHSHIEGFAKFKTEVDTFRFNNAKTKTTDMVFIGGDSYVGGNKPRNKVIVAAQNMIMPDANIYGNHEFDWKGSLGLSERTDAAKFKTLALNLKMKPDCALKDDFEAGRMAKSMVIEKNGEKFGVIGLLPSDLFPRVSQATKDYCKDFDVMSLPETFKAVQDEVNKFEKEGVNKIILLSHMGYGADVAMAKMINGVDVIHGSHSHDIFKGLVPGVNYFTSQRGEPVIITQAGKNGHAVGVLDYVFDDKGKIIQAQNTIKPLDKTAPSLLVELAKRVIMGKPEVIGTFDSNAKNINEYALEENPISSLLCDAFKKYTGADIILTNAGGIRSGVHKGEVTDEQIKELMPYFNEMVMYKFSEKEIVETLNNAVKATRKYNRTGAVQVAGLEYTIGKDDKIKDISLVKDDGTKEKIDANHPRADKFYTVSYNAYLYGGPEGLENLHAPEKKIKTFEMTETDMIINYIKSFNGKPIKVEKTGRIKTEQ